MKKILSLVIAFAMVAMTAMTAFARETPSNSSLETLQALPYEQKLDRLDWHEYTELDNISIEDTYTYEEMLAYLEENGFTEEEALNFVGERPIEARSTTIHYSLLKMTPNSPKSGYEVQFRVNAGLEYLSGSSSPNRIVSLGGAHVGTDGGKNCVFTGGVFYELMSGNRLYYNVFGDIYKTGSVQWTVSATIGIGDSANVSASVSGSSEYLAPVEYNEEYTWTGLMA